ncbi:UDP-N-acetylmuramoylalanine--D-glutamate ligase [Sphingomonas sp. Leaf357]|uniref:UDP-N-acetylmuramoyl-L-alanine--D-glutamate ligase n=1 Tax=Sphingomonas sp. Leaf357 TaxID=1736350 RepID=UPI0006F9E633|nr:UDP-N-acetylmuramoyl-L-alanine--D-glutamate ligase [Sphingomonas sp. Leaf357]KQS01958.1 UDP-N-acetylmuramoylalanine--D-glutamate ligase [Sphingomonas sp. Leaf357]
MITSDLWRGKRFAVLGLARSGAATVRALLASGAEVVAWDSDAAKREGLTSPRLSFADPELIDLAGFDALVVSPGVPLNRHPVAAKARAAGVPIIGDIELFAQARVGLPSHKVVGVTGTNGKSTTVSLIHHILQTAGVPSRLGGNIGLPILEQEPLPEGGVYVLELSSYQIDLTQTLDCDVAVLLNITPDHLDRYDGFEAYAASKLRLFAMQTGYHVMVVDNETDAMFGATEEREDPLIYFSDMADVSAQNEWPSLKGPHNAANAACAIATCIQLDIAAGDVELGLRTFTGLPHRMERVATKHGVAFVNDSKATNPESAAPALAAFDRVHWILGGQSKSDDLDACAPSFGHVVRAYTIGAAGPKFAAILKGRMPVEESATLAAAVISAAAQAKPGETVLLSPACASFDQFRDFEDRGDQFRQAVEALA